MSEKTYFDLAADKLRDRAMRIGAAVMIESLKADRMIPDDINKESAASEAIRRHGHPMAPPNSIADMKEEKGCRVRVRNAIDLIDHPGGRSFQRIVERVRAILVEGIIDQEEINHE